MKQLFFTLTLLVNVLFPQSNVSSLDAWRNIFQTEEIVHYFNGVFNKIGVQVEETGESFTVDHIGDKIVLRQEIEPDVDFIVPVKIQNIKNMIAHAEDGEISSNESWKIVNVLFTPMTRVTLTTPVLAVNWRRKLAGVEDLIHVYLLSPNQENASKHTLVYVKGQWLVINGLHGEPKRTYRMTADQALDYQRKVFAAMEIDSYWNWFKFAKWYKNWRKTCSVTHS